MNSVHAVMKIICPAGTDESAAVFLEDFFHRIPLLLALGIRILFWFFYWLPCLVVRRFKPVTQLDESVLECYLGWWEQNRFYFIREGFNTLKTIALLARVGKDWDPHVV